MQNIVFKKIDIESYRPGKSTISRKKKVIKLSANESALGSSSRIKTSIFKSSKLFRYPDPRSRNLRLEISKRFNCNFNQIICGSGSDEVIQMLCQLFLNKSDEVIVPKYSFLMYRIYPKIIGAKVIFANEINFKVSVKEILRKVTKKTKMVFLANPNNPTGTYLNYKELKNLRKKLRQNILLIIDDAYQEYMINKDYLPSLKLFKNSKNVFTLRTFSKIYGLASLRVGWGYGSKKIVEGLMRIKPPFNVTNVGEFSAVESLKDKVFIKKSVKHNLNWANKLKKILKNYNISTNEVTANFLFLNFDKCKLTSSYVKKKLEQKGIIVRSLEIYKIKNKLRITIGNTKENVLLIKAFKTIFKNV